MVMPTGFQSVTPESQPGPFDTFLFLFGMVWSQREIGAILRLGKLSGRRGGEDDYEVRGFPEQHLLFQAAGQIEDVAPELCARQSALRWRSVTPYLPVRHRHKRQTVQDYLAADVTADLGYHNMAAPVSVTVTDPLAAWSIASAVTG